MSDEMLLTIRVIAIVLIGIVVFFFGWNIWRNYRQDKEDGDYDKYRRSTLDANEPLAKEPDDALIPSNVVMQRRTSQLNPAFLASDAERQTDKADVRGKKMGAAMPGDAEKTPPSMTLPYTLMARYGRKFSGKDIEKLVRHFALTRSPANAFELVGEEGEVLLTMLNVRKPGVFPKDLAELDSLEGVMLILQLPAGNDPMNSWQTFNAMAHDMMHAIDGRLCDYRRRPLGESDMQRYRQAAEQFADEYTQWLKNQ